MRASRNTAALEADNPAVRKIQMPDPLSPVDVLPDRLKQYPGKGFALMVRNLGERHMVFCRHGDRDDDAVFIKQFGARPLGE